jgi:hypothetical protein
MLFPLRDLNPTRRRPLQVGFPIDDYWPFLTGMLLDAATCGSINDERSWDSTSFPSMAMYRSWQALLPGFTWISWSSFLLGLVESYGYGWFVALIRVPLYNVFNARAGRR